MTSPERLVVGCLRADSSVMSLLVDEDRRLDAAWQGDLRAIHATVEQAGGSFDAYAPLRSCVMFAKCYAGSRPAASELAEAVALSLRNVDQRSAPVLSATVESVAWTPTPEGVPRYTVTAVVTVRFSPVAA